MATPIDYNAGSNRPLRLYTPTLDPTGPNMAGTCGGTNIGLSTGVLDNASYYSGMRAVDDDAIPKPTIGDAAFPASSFQAYNPATEYLTWATQWEVADQVATPGQALKSGWPSMYNVTGETAQIGDAAWGPVTLS